MHEQLRHAAKLSIFFTWEIRVTVRRTRFNAAYGCGIRVAAKLFSKSKVVLHT
jgi:hypothetical protein